MLTAVLEDKRVIAAMVTIGVVGVSAMKRLWNARSGPNGRFFSDSYFEARDKFRAAAAKAGLTDIEAHTVVESDPLSGGQRLTIDVAVLRGDPSQVLFHFSGTHGVEGFCGSGVQSRILEDISENPEKYKRGPTVVFVHAVNPYGFAHCRRFNEENVDLNRNLLLTDEKWREVLARKPNEFGYENFDSLINPKHAMTQWDCFMYYVKAPLYIAYYGFNNIKQALVTGQYHNNRGVNFGGRSLQKSHRIVQNNIIKPRLQKPEVKTFMIVDVHSGLGPCGVDTLMVGGPREVEFCSKMGCTATTEDNDSSDASGQAGSGAYTKAVGLTASYAEWCRREFPRIKNPFVLTEEFGTIDTVSVGLAMAVEVSGYHYAQGTKRHEWAKAKARAAFYVETEWWKASVARRGLQLFREVYTGIEKLS